MTHQTTANNRQRKIGRSQTKTSGLQFSKARQAEKEKEEAVAAKVAEKDTANVGILANKDTQRESVQCLGSSMEELLLKQAMQWRLRSTENRKEKDTTEVGKEKGKAMANRV